MRAPVASRRLFAVAFLVAVGCGADAAVAPSPPPPPGAPVASTQQRITVDAPAADVAAVVASNTQLGLDLKRALVGATPQDNLVFSPYSVSAALAMAYGGSAGTTHDAFDRVLHLTVAEPTYHRAMNTLDRQLAARGQGAHGVDGQAFHLDVTNQLFADMHSTFLPAYLDLLAQEYGADARLLDFRNAPDPSRVSINDWVTQKTGGYIQDLLALGIVTRDTRGVLVNAIYFNAAWAKRFDAAATTDAPFRLLDGTTATVKTMRTTLSSQAATVDGVEVVSVPYDGRELSLVILMPAAGSFADWERALGAADIARYAAARKSEELDLSMPKFTTRTSSKLTQVLKDLGLAAAFSPDQADFSRMSATEPLLITDVVHQAIIIVDERGTVAAAATGVGIGTSSAPPPPRRVLIDHPFVYLIRDEPTGAILFLGRCVNPGA
jgi:serpin B